MKKPHGRITKIKVGQLLESPSRQDAMNQLARIPDQQLISPLFSYFFHKNELIKFRAAVAMGALTARMADTNIENARIILRRIMWNLNDESGGIGWGSPEAMGDILFLSPGLAKEFKSILFSYLAPTGNFIEHEMLQRGVIWGIGTFLKADPKQLDTCTKNLLVGFLQSTDPIKRGYALRALARADQLDCSLIPEAIVSDEKEIPLFNGWEFSLFRIMDLAALCQ